ncbi:MAG: hypothetical protein L7U70_05320 [Flavobacteriales bacterium]|nr:hypothetical protein [Flavobacteriales bacterium]
MWKLKKNFSLKKQYSIVNRRFKYLLFVVLSISLTSQAQNGNDFIFFEARLQTLANKVLTATTDSLKEEANRLLVEDLEEVLLIKGSFHYSFENIENLSIIDAPDESFKIFNWVMPKENGSFEYFAYLQFYNKRSKNLHFIKLHDASHDMENEQFKILEGGDWYGALYSEVLHNSFNKKDYYTLVGWDGNNEFTTKRIIDILHFNEELQPIFGAPILKMNDGTRSRMVMEYSKKTSTNMAYNEDTEYIVFDQLEPIDGAEKGMYEFYVPNLSYDGLTFKNGKWRLVENIPAYNDKKRNRKQLKNIERGLQAP